MVAKNRRTRKTVSREEKLRRIFLRRTAASYHSHKRRAAKAGQRLDYGLSELRTLVQEGLRGNCPYCGCELTGRNFSVDHAVPTSRGGDYEWRNLKICCRRCNETKGVLTVNEFDHLRDATRFWPRAIRQNLFARIRAGSRFARHIYSDLPPFAP